MVKKNTDILQNENTQSQFPPVVAVLGHVDHGKTTLLDAIRKSNVAGKEHGSITQRIGASSVTTIHEDKPHKITFLDTPGHETFSRMRSRGAQVADIGILVVAANDGVMPQTKESINMLKTAGIPIIVAITKVDLPEKNVEKVKQQVMREGILLEGLGGDVPYVEVSAKTGQNIQALLELVLIVVQVHEVKKGTSASGSFSGVVIESRLDPKVGPRATIVVKNGTIKLRDQIEVDGIYARVRTITNEDGKHLASASVGDAIEILGFENVPSVGSIVVTKGQAMEKPVAKVQVMTPEPKMPMGLEMFSSRTPSTHTLSVILVADTRGSLEAITAALPKDVTIFLQKTGEITSADVMMAKSIGAIVIGFNVKMPAKILQLARTEKVLVKNYTIIYELIDELSDALEGKILAQEEQILGEAKVLASFPFENTKVLGIAVRSGRIAKGDKVRLLRNDDVIGESTIVSVRLRKEVVSKVEAGKEAGIVLSPFLDFTIGDMILSHD
ncbi:MAG: translation initiation factor IF-2 [Candidatus Levybacteria bacterium]|nr:translation initiation factor IF-2 [Candidatus Levybacteria bacterium]